MINGWTCLLLEDHVTVVVIVRSLNQDAHEGNHCKSSVADLPVLVVHPSSITVIGPVGGSEDVTGLVSWAFLDLLSQPFNGSASKNELGPTDRVELLSGFKRVVGELAIKGGVDTSGVEVPSQAGSHGDTSVLEFSLAVVAHGLIVLALGKTEGIKESHGGEDSDTCLVLPCRQRGSAGLLLDRGESGAIERLQQENRA
jgi:hypothetical protein